MQFSLWMLFFNVTVWFSQHSQRPSPSLAATACHMLLWQFPLDKLPTQETIRPWIMCLCVKLICGSRQNTMHHALLATFLKRCQLAEIMEGWKLLTVSPVYWTGSRKSFEVQFGSHDFFPVAHKLYRVFGVFLVFNAVTVFFFLPLINRIITALISVYLYIGGTKF